MSQRWCPVLLVALLVFEGGGCATMEWPELSKADARLGRTAYQSTVAVHPGHGMTLATVPVPAPHQGELTGPQPVDVYIRRALAENRTVQAAFHNVQSLKHRIPQVTALDDPVASNSIFPIPAVGPQYSLMGYNPYNLTLTQAFPWFGTRSLRGEVADRDVKVALAEFSAAQLDTVTAVKRAYYDLYTSQRTNESLTENRKILEDFNSLARSKLAAGGSQQDVIRSETLISELDRSLANNQQDIASARAALARQIHISPEANLGALNEIPATTAPAQIERLYELAVTARPELQGRLAAIARDEKTVELARKRFYPNVTLGLTYMDMEKTNAQTPRTAGGVPNIGFFVGFNLPVYRAKYRAGVCEAEQRTLADVKLYEAQRDETYSEIRDFMTQAKVQQGVLSLLRDSILPRTKDTLDLSRSDYGKGNVDSATVLSAQREVLQVQLQIAQIEGELGKALASLERAVGSQWNELQLAAKPSEPPSSAPTPPAPVPADPGPFESAVPPRTGEISRPENGGSL